MEWTTIGAFAGIYVMYVFILQYVWRIESKLDELLKVEDVNGISPQDRIDARKIQERYKGKTIERPIWRRDHE